MTGDFRFQNLSSFPLYHPAPQGAKTICGQSGQKPLSDLNPSTRLFMIMIATGRLPVKGEIGEKPGVESGRPDDVVLAGVP